MLGSILPPLGFPNKLLGYAIRQYPPEKSEPEQALACKTVVTPSAEASRHHVAVIEERLEQLRAASQAQVISELNPIIGGWATYYNGFVSVHSLSRYDELVSQLLLSWARKHHPNKERQEVINAQRHFMLTAEERIITPDRIIDPLNGPFLNGSFRPVIVPDTMMGYGRDANASRLIPRWMNPRDELPSKPEKRCHCVNDAARIKLINIASSGAPDLASTGARKRRQMSHYA